MHRSLPFRLGAILLGALGGLAPQVTAADFSPEAPFQITQTTQPQFPHELEPTGLRAGEADVAVAVDPSGRLQDVLVVGYTQKPFATDAVRSIRTWKFTPTGRTGSAEGWTHVFRIRYRLEGLNVVVDRLEALRAVFGLPATRLARDPRTPAPDDPGALAYQVCSPRELDRIPKPKNIVAPEGRHEGTVDIEFYIDETGQVRIPAVRSGTDPALAAAALTAVRQWQFEPPVRSGVPVLVRVDQIFHFKPAPEPPTSHAASETHP